MKVSTALFLVTLIFAGSAAAQPPGRPAADPARGLVYNGLQRAQDGPCKTGFELLLPGARLGCTHGPDASPPGRNVLRERSLADLAASTAAAGGDATGLAGGVPCVGDGVTGNRVQAVYAYPAGQKRQLRRDRALHQALGRGRRRDLQRQRGRNRRSPPRPLRDRPGLRARGREGRALAGRGLQPRGHRRRPGGPRLRPPRPQVPRLGRRLCLLRGRHGEAGRQAFSGQREQRGRPAGHGGAGRSRLLGRRQPLDRGARARPSPRRRAAERSECERQLPLHGRRRGPLLRR